MNTPPKKKLSDSLAARTLAGALALPPSIPAETAAYQSGYTTPHTPPEQSFSQNTANSLAASKLRDTPSPNNSQTPDQKNENDENQENVEDEDLNPAAQGPGGIRGEINDYAAPVMSLINRRKIKDLEGRIDDLERQNTQLKKQAETIRSDKLKPLQRQLLAASFADFTDITLRYLKFSIEIWWWTIIGAIIDIFIIIPTLFIVYVIAKKEGRVSKGIKQAMQPFEKEIKDLEKKSKDNNRQIQQTQIEKIRLTQLFKGPAAA